MVLIKVTCFLFYREFKERDERETKKQAENGKAEGVSPDKNGSGPTAKKPKLDEMGNELVKHPDEESDTDDQDSEPETEETVAKSVQEGEDYKEFLAELKGDGE